MSSSDWSSARSASDQRNKAAFLADLEARYVALEKERNDLLQKSQKDRDTITALQKSRQEVEETLASTKAELVDSKRDAQSGIDRALNVESDQKNLMERASRIESEADDLREEISRLTQANKGLREQLIDFEVKAQLDDSAVVPLQYEKERLQKELDSLSAHAKWMETELASRSEQLASTRTRHGEELMKLREEVDQAIFKRDEASSQISTLKKSNQDLTSRVESLSNDLRQKRCDASTAVESFEKEIQAERSLCTLQKEQLDRLQSRHDLMESELESLRTLTSRNTQQTQIEVNEMRARVEEEAKKVLSQQQEAHKSEIAALKEEIKEANRLRAEAQDGLLPTARRSPSRRQTPERAGDPAVEPIGLTDLYAKLSETEDELLIERTERKKLSLYLQKIQADIAAKTPIIQRQKREYEWAMEQREEAHVRLKNALEDVSVLREEKQELRIESSQMHRRHREILEENRELAKQVQGLLASKAGGDVPAGIPTSIQEMQSQNEELLRENIRISNLVKELEGKLKDDSHVARLEAANGEIQRLQEERKRQETLVTGIVQQRDLYRALVVKQDGHFGSETQHTSELVVAQQAGRVHEMEERVKAMDAELSKTRSDLSLAQRESQTSQERISRYSSHTAELTESIDKLQLEISSAKAAGARFEAEASYHRDKCIRLEEAIQLSKNEMDQVKASKKELHNTTYQLQKAVIASKAEVTKHENEARQGESKLRLLETKLESSKATESRLSSEVSRMRTELSRQGALLDSVQRIEATLKAQNEEAKEKLKGDCDRLTQLLETERSQHQGELVSLQSRASEAEAILTAAEQKNEKAIAELDRARKESTVASSEVKGLQAKCERLEAELSSARKKLGDTVVDESSAAVEAKVESLSKQLDAAREVAEKAKERVLTYQNIAKKNEEALSDLTKSMDDFKRSKSKEANDLKARLELSTNENLRRQEVIEELTNDLSDQRDEQQKAVSELKSQLATFKEQSADAKKTAEAAIARAESSTAEMQQYRSNARESQVNYERELTLHATARADLRAATEEIASEKRLRQTAEDRLGTAKLEIEEQSALFANEKKAVEQTVAELTKSLHESRAQNDVLHNQLASLDEMIKKSQSTRIESLETESAESQETGLQKNVSELREIVRFMRAERDTNRAQLDAALRAVEREKAGAVVVKKALEDARAELTVLERIGEPSGSLQKEVEDLKERLKSADSQLTLVGESNKLLREEATNLEKNLRSLRSERDQLKSSLAPTENQMRVLEVEKTELVSEKESLRREVDSWKKRVRSLVSKFNQVDPEQHNKALAEVETLRKKCEDLKGDKERADKANQSAKLQLMKLNKDLSHQKGLAEKQGASLSKLLKEKEAASKSTSSADSAAAKDRDELRERVKKLTEEAKSKATELKGTEERNTNLKVRMRQLMKELSDQKAKVEQLEEKVNVTEAKLAEKMTVVAAVDLQSEQPSTLPSFSSQALSDSRGEKPADKPESVRERDQEATTASVVPSVPEGGFKFGPGGVRTIEDSGPEKTAKPNPALGIRQPDSIRPRKPPSEPPLTAGDTPVKPSAAQTPSKPTESRPSEFSPAPRSPLREQADGEAVGVLREKLEKKKRKLEKKKEEERAKKRATMEINEATPDEAAPKASEESSNVIATSMKSEHMKNSMEASKSVKSEPPSQQSSKEPEMRHSDASLTSQVDRAQEDNPEAGLNAMAASFVPGGHAKDIKANEMALGRIPATAEGAKTTIVASQGGTTAHSNSPFVFGSATAPQQLGSKLAAAPAFGSGAFVQSSGASGSAISGNAEAMQSVFLDMRPPNAKNAAPFSFGTATIKLPTPANPSASSGSSPFGAFNASPFGNPSTPGGFGGGLFGSSSSVKKVDATEGNVGELPQKSANVVVGIAGTDDDTGDNGNNVEGQE